jgi:hypothetical protein
LVKATADTEVVFLRIVTCKETGWNRTRVTTAILMLNWRHDSLVLSLSPASHPLIKSEEGSTHVMGFKISHRQDTPAHDTEIKPLIREKADN